MWVQIQRCSPITKKPVAVRAFSPHSALPNLLTIDHRISPSHFDFRVYTYTCVFLSAVVCVTVVCKILFPNLLHATFVWFRSSGCCVISASRFVLPATRRFICTTFIGCDLRLLTELVRVSQTVRQSASIRWGQVAKKFLDNLSTSNCISSRSFLPSPDLSLT